ncbi:hypothetical protein Tco_0698193 [Tanacetum coccineum]
MLVIPMVAAAGSRQVKIHSHMLILDRHMQRHYESSSTCFKTSATLIPHVLRDKVLKLKNFKKDENTSFQEQEQYDHVGPKVTSTQDGKRSQDDDSRLCSADDLKEAQNHMQVNLKKQAQP